MKILVIGGMHGNEPLGPQVVRLIEATPLKNVDVVLANQKAIAGNCRFVANDLNRSFPGVLQSGDYEGRRAAELLARTKEYDVVLDFHNTHCPGNDCGFVGQTAPQRLYDVASWLGLPRIIVADYDCINKYAPNCVSIEISLDSPKMSAAHWRDKIAALSRLEAIPVAEDIQKYRFVYRMTLEDKQRLELPQQNLQAFEAIAPKLATAMGVASPAYPIFINDAYTPYNYGGLLNKL